MGTYRRIVCEIHKEVLDLNKSFDISSELRDLVCKNTSDYLLYDKEVIRFKGFSGSLRNMVIHLENETFRTKQIGMIKSFLRKHRDCELKFQPEDHEENEVSSSWKWECICGWC